MNELSATSAVILAGLTGAYLYVYFMYRRRYFLYVGLAWAANAIYIFAELKISAYGTEDFGAAVVATATSSIGTVFFWLALADLRRFTRRERWRMSGVLIAATTVAVLVGFCPAQDVLRWRTELLTSLAALATAVPLVCSAFSFFAMPRENLLLFLRNSPGSPFEPPSAQIETSHRVSIVPQGLRPGSPPVTAAVNAALRSSKRLTVVSFAIYGSLQLTYPFRAWIDHHAYGHFTVLFWVALAAKTLNGSALPLLVLADFRSTAEALRTRSVAEQLGVLTASVEHDIRSPVAILLKEIATLKSQNQANGPLVQRLSKLQKHIARIEAAASVIPTTRDIVERFGALATDINLVAVVRDAAAAVKKIDKRGDLHIDVDAPRSRIFIHGDRARLMQAFVNIINNGVEASRSRSRTSPNIAISCVVGSKTQCVVRIRDNGTGLSEDVKANLGRPFFSTKPAEGRNRGIGVFIATRTIAMHGGDVDFESDGATFTEVIVRLPRATDQKG